MKQAIIYCRFSPRSDADTSKSNEQQEERCRAYCERQGYRILAVCEDKAISGKTIHRAGLSTAIDKLTYGAVLVVDTQDRLARDILAFLTIQQTVMKRGAIIETADGAPQRCTPEGKLFSNILAAFAQYERERYARRTKAGLAKKKANGEWLGRAPIGWRYDKASKRLLQHPIEMKAIDVILGYHQAGQPSQWIAYKLNEQLGPLRGKPWSARTVRKIISSKQ